LEIKSVSKRGPKASRKRQFWGNNGKGEMKTSIGWEKKKELAGDCGRILLNNNKVFFIFLRSFSAKGGVQGNQIFLDSRRGE
jgi:hypothetical protein